MSLLERFHLTEQEQWLLDWLGDEPYAQYGECHGVTLDALIEKGLAQVHEDPELQKGFIVQGDGPMYRAVSLTDDGRLVRLLLADAP